MPADNMNPDLGEKIRAYQDVCRRRLAERFAAERERRREAGQFFHEGYWLTVPQLARLKKKLAVRRFAALIDFHLLLVVVAAVVFAVLRIFDVFLFP
jgi:hypothetical protein